MSQLLRLRGDRGSALPIEAILLVPALVLTVGFVIIMGRYSIASDAVTAAAGAGARAAALERSAGSGQAAAKAVVAASLASQSVECLNTSVTVSTAGFAVQVGKAATVSVTVQCTIDATGFGINAGTKTITATASSPLDTYRGRQP